MMTKGCCYKRDEPGGPLGDASLNPGRCQGFAIVGWVVDLGQAPPTASDYRIRRMDEPGITTRTPTSDWGGECLYALPQCGVEEGRKSSAGAELLTTWNR